ncbi:MAG: PD-(D/E)XK nuclease family transposase [Sarcina sp.]
MKVAKEKNYKNSSIERWLAFLEKDIPETTLKELIELEPAIEKAENKLEYLSGDEDAMRLYWERERSLHERANMINSAKDKGREEGKIEAAISFLDILDDETIASKLGLDINLVRGLRK